MKIGLLAMSGIRAHDPELLALGLTLPGFVERSRQIASLPSLGLLSLAAATPPGHDLRYLEAESDRTEPAEVYSCDLVAISTFSAQVLEAYAIADRLRRAGVRVAMGGLHVSVRPTKRPGTPTTSFVGKARPRGRRSCGRRRPVRRPACSTPRILARWTWPRFPFRVTTFLVTGRTTASRCRPRAGAPGAATSARRR